MMRHGKAWGPSALRRVRIRELRKVGEYLVADTREALVALAQMGVVDIHTWNADADEPYLHDRVILDLDPGAAVGWSAVVGAAKLIRKALAAVGLASWVKTTGGKGLHVVAPVERAPYEACLAFTRTTAAALVQHDPALFTTDVRKEGREDKILIEPPQQPNEHRGRGLFPAREGRGAGVISDRLGRPDHAPGSHALQCSHRPRLAAPRRRRVGRLRVGPPGAAWRVTRSDWPQARASRLFGAGDPFQRILDGVTDVERLVEAKHLEDGLRLSGEARHADLPAGLPDALEERRYDSHARRIDSASVHGGRRQLSLRVIPRWRSPRT